MSFAGAVLLGLAVVAIVGLIMAALAGLWMVVVGEWREQRPPAAATPPVLVTATVDRLRVSDAALSLVADPTQFLHESVLLWLHTQPSPQGSAVHRAYDPDKRETVFWVEEGGDEGLGEPAGEKKARLK